VAPPRRGIWTGPTPSRRKSRPHPQVWRVERSGRLVLYLTDDLERGKPYPIDPKLLLAVLQKKHFAKPPDFHFQFVRDPSLWWNEVSVGLIAALKDELQAPDRPQ
jgi:hypothetical protein